MKRCKIIGLTGQTGAGKSTVLRCWQRRDVCVFDSDLVVRKIYDGGSACLKAVAAQFGADIINADQSLNRPLLAQRAFADPESTRALNELVHPFVMAEMLKTIKRERPEVLICDAPQLFESNLDVLCDVIVSVVAEEETRIKRICRRDGLTEQQARQRVSAQYDEAFFRAHSDHVLENNSDESQLLHKAEAIAQVIF